MKMNKILDKIFQSKDRKRYLALCFFCGIMLMLIPTNSPQSDRSQTEKCDVFSIENEETRLEGILSSIKGVGKCKVLLSVHDSTQKILAENEGDTVVISNGGSQSIVTIQEVFPRFQGAVVVADGNLDAHIRYDILSAVMSYTGLESNKITICPMKESIGGAK